jgi:hypothetical protein
MIKTKASKELEREIRKTHSALAEANFRLMSMRKQGPMKFPNIVEWEVHITGLERKLRKLITLVKE